MSALIEDELRAGLREATAGITAPADLAARVRRRAGRRRTLTRLSLAAAPVAVAAAVAAIVLLGTLPGGRPYTPPTAEEVGAALSTADRADLTEPTRGDLAGDTAYLAAVVAAWRDGQRRSGNADRGIFDHPVGEPTVVWAGSTPAGRAAYVVQAFDLRQHENIQLEREGPALLWGFVGPGADGAPTLVADGYPVPGAPETEGALIGPDRRTLLVADRHRTVDLSWGNRYAEDGTVTRDWRRVRFTDGVALFAVPAGVASESVTLRAAGEGQSQVGNLSEPTADADTVYAGPEDRRLPWAPEGADRPVFPVGTDPAAAWGGRLPDTAGAEAPFGEALSARQGPFTSAYLSLWHVAGTTADGSRLVAGELQLDSDPSRAYVVLSTPDGAVRVTQRPTEPGAAVPVRVPVARGQGWLLAAKGARFTWTEGGAARSAQDAALVPAGAADVRADGAPVDLR